MYVNENGECECPLCFDPIKKATTLDCGHTFDGKCVEIMEECPYCNKKIEFSFINNSIQELIDFDPSRLQEKTIEHFDSCAVCGEKLTGSKAFHLKECSRLVHESCLPHLKTQQTFDEKKLVLVNAFEYKEVIAEYRAKEITGNPGKNINQKSLIKIKNEINFLCGLHPNADRETYNNTIGEMTKIDTAMCIVHRVLSGAENLVIPKNQYFKIMYPEHAKTGKAPPIELQKSMDFVSHLGSNHDAIIKSWCLFVDVTRKVLSSIRRQCTSTRAYEVGGTCDRTTFPGLYKKAVDSVATLCITGAFMLRFLCDSNCLNWAKELFDILYELAPESMQFNYKKILNTVAIAYPGSDIV